MMWLHSPLPIRSASTLLMSAPVLTPPPSPPVLPLAELTQSVPSITAPSDCPTPYSHAPPPLTAVTPPLANRWSAAPPAATPSSLRASLSPPSTALPPSTQRCMLQLAPSRASRPRTVTAPTSSPPSSTPCVLHVLAGMPHARGSARLALAAWRTAARAATCLTHLRATTMPAPMSLACGMESRATNSPAASPVILMPLQLPLLHRTWSCLHRLCMPPPPPLPRPHPLRSCGPPEPLGSQRHASSAPPLSTHPPIPALSCRRASPPQPPPPPRRRAVQGTTPWAARATLA